jgi:repressor LexA
VLCGDRFNVDGRQLVLSNPTQMIETRGREARPAPVVHGRNAGAGSIGYRSRAAKRIDECIREAVHSRRYAEMAFPEQELFCQNGICHIGMADGLTRDMDIEEIRARMKERNYNQGDMANLLGIDPTAVSKRLTGKRAFKHSEMLKVEAWLGYEGGDPELPAANVRMIPIIGLVAAGTMKEAIQQSMGDMPVPASTPPGAVALRVDGDSMDMEIEDGGTVIVDRDDRTLFPGRLYVIVNGEGEATFKQFESEPARLVPRSTNPSHTTIFIGDGTTFKVFGRVTALHRLR